MIFKHFLVPDYLLTFQCAMCGICCKLPWDIYFDKATVKKYHGFAAADEAFAAQLKEGIIEKKDIGAVVKFSTESAGCPFLSGEGLCSIQGKFGVEAISDTCKSFPRKITLTERGCEIALSYACATAAATLKQRESIQFYQDPLGFQLPSMSGQYDQIGSVLERSKRGKTNYFEVEELLIDIMQFRELELDTRLILTGIILDKLKNGDKEGARRYLRNLDETLIRQFQNMPANPILSINFVKGVTNFILVGGRIKDMMPRLLKLVYQELKLLNGEVVSDSQAKRLTDAYRQYYQPYLSEINHVYENYFVNFIFSKKFYSYNYFDAYSLMIFFYSFIRFFTLCTCLAEERQADEEMVIDVIHTIELAIGHNKAFYEKVLKQIKRDNYNRLPIMLSLINLA